MKYFTLLTECGPVGIAIGFCAFVVLLIAAERYLYLHRCAIDTRDFLRGIINQLRSRNTEVAVQNCDNTHSPVGDVVRSAIEHWSDGPHAIRNATEETAALTIPRLEQNLKLLAFLGNFSPVLGLVGTLCSMLRIFATIADKKGEFLGTVDLAVEIRTALFCTVLGLIVAAIAQLCYFLLTEMIDKHILEMRKAASEITFFLSENPPEDDQKPCQSSWTNDDSLESPSDRGDSAQDSPEPGDPLQ